MLTVDTSDCFIYFLDGICCSFGNLWSSRHIVIHTVIVRTTRSHHGRVRYVGRVGEVGLKTGSLKGRMVGTHPVCEQGCCICCPP